MSMKPGDQIIAPSRGTRVEAVAYANDHGAMRAADLSQYIVTVYDLCEPDDMPDASIAVAQSAHETGYWQSYWWSARLNPAGMGITGDPTENLQSPTFKTGEESARAQVSHLLVYAIGPADAGSLWFQRFGQSIRTADPRYDAYLEAYGNTAQAQTIADLAGTWAMDKAYAAGVCARGNAIYPNLDDFTAQEEDVPTYTTTVPGLPGGSLITTYPIYVNLIPASNTRQRPGIPARLPRRSVQHGTGNPSNADAAAEARYFVNGAEGRQASVHYCTDDQKAIVVVPLNEVTWQAADGSGPGNMCGFSCEMMEANAIWNDPARTDRLIGITADLMGRTAARLDAQYGPEQHWTFNYGVCGCSQPCNTTCPDRHDCPNKLRHTPINGRAAWDIYADRWETARKDELRRMHGTPSTTTTANPTPSTTTTAAPPKPGYPEGLDEDLATAWFGSKRAKGSDGKLHTYAFNPTGDVSQLWMKNGKATGEWPKITAVETYDTRMYWRFANGWTCWQPNSETPVAALK